MVKRFIWVAIATVLFLFQVQVSSASAIELDRETLSVPLDDTERTTVLSEKELTNGQRVFNSSCTKCHLQGKTKTNNNVSLGLSDLKGAEPPLDNLLALVDFLKKPTSYDGEDDYSEIHPNVTRTDIFSDLKNLTEDDVYDVAGYVLIAPKLDSHWGGTIYF